MQPQLNLVAADQPRSNQKKQQAPGRCHRSCSRNENLQFTTWGSLGAKSL